MSLTKEYPARRSWTGCKNCRLKHLKCDDAKPSCARCLKSGLECIRALSIRFRYSSNPSVSANGLKACEFSFESDQVWCDTSHQEFTFFDESRHLHAIYNEEEVEEDTQEGDDQLDPAPVVQRAYSKTPTPSPKAHVYEPDPFEPSHVESASSTLEFDPQALYPNYHSGGAGSHHTTVSPVSQAVSAANASNGLDTVTVLPPCHELHLWPFQNATEAHLIRYFIQHVSRRFDMCDPQRHFALVVPCRAAECLPLMNAAFALSARQLSQTTEMDEYLADKYYQKCLNSLVPLFDDPMALTDENLFAATVILRTLEEIEVPLSGADSETHLLGSHLFIGASDSVTSPASTTSGTPGTSTLTGLRRASYLVAFRQEIFTAFVSQRSVSSAFCPPDISRRLDEPADDATYTNRILLHMADVLNYCYGSDGMRIEQSAGLYDRLVEYGEQWYAKKPASFRPIFYEDAGNRLHWHDGSEDGSPTESRRLFPKIWLLSDAVAQGLLHWHLSKILLLAFDPRAPRIGIMRKRFMQQQNEEIRNHIKILVGISLGNTECSPNAVLACMGISMAGERFDELWEQNELMDFLRKTEKTAGWSTITAQTHLAEAWGWGEHDW